jgi:urease accessory protein
MNTTPTALIPPPEIATAADVAAAPASDAMPSTHPAGITPLEPARARSRVRARLALEFAHDAEAGCTRLRSSHQEPPLKAVRTFPAADGAALLHLHNVSGGLLGGDELSLNAKSRPGSHGAAHHHRRHQNLPSTNEGTPGHPNQRESPSAKTLSSSTSPIPSSRTQARASHSARRFISAGAGLFWWEILSPGREAHGEVFQYASIEVRTDVTAHGRPICSERVRLQPRQHDLSSAARMGNYRYWATFYICRVGIEPSAWRALEDRVRERSAAFQPVGEARWGVSTLSSDGLVIRGMAHHGRDAYSGLLAFWRVAKQALYGQEPVLPRKVY